MGGKGPLGGGPTGGSSTSCRERGDSVSLRSTGGKYTEFGTSTGICDRICFSLGCFEPFGGSPMSRGGRRGDARRP